MGKIGIFLKQKTVITLVLIFLVAVFLRFLYFPENIYFGYDQARDAFESQGILNGEFKLVGPTTSTPGFNHGALFYYIFAVVYFLSGNDPTGLAVFLRIYNALGVILVFFIGVNLFSEKSKSTGKWVGIAAAILFAFSYEQTQYALFMTHPALAVLSVLIFYLGLSMLIFRNNPTGLTVTLLGLGLSFQFHFLLIYLIPVFIISMFTFRHSLPRISWKVVLMSFILFTGTVSTFALAEIKYNFSMLKSALQYFANPESTGVVFGGFNSALSAAKRYASDNLLAVPKTEILVLTALLFLALYFFRYKELRNQMIFLLIWFFGGLISYVIDDTSLYFYGVGTSVSLLVFTAFLIIRISSKYSLITLALLLIIPGSNLYLIQKNNPGGPNKEINVQAGMLLGDQKRAIDYMYNKAEYGPFAVNAFSMPLYINTTWAYLFEWYGQGEYGYVPTWGGRNAEGHRGNLIVNNSRSTLPDRRFLIIEPIRGSEGPLINFFTNESWFTDTIEEKRFGEILVDYQKPK